jgi:hypothetical protein
MASITDTSTAPTPISSALIEKRFDRGDATGGGLRFWCFGIESIAVFRRPRRDQGQP